MSVGRWILKQQFQHRFFFVPVQQYREWKRSQIRHYSNRRKNRDLPENVDKFSTSDDYRIETVLIANSSELIDVNMPSEYSLSHAYPNPFNNSTNIDFNIPNDANVTVQIYNLLGKEVATLIDSRMDAGYHHLIWDANSIASGIYFIHMNSNNFTQTEKIILLK